MALVIANAGKTTNIRAYISPWYTGVSRVPDAITTQIGRVIALLEAKVAQGYFCKPDEFLFIYNFQIVEIVNHNIYCSLDMLIRPKSELNKLTNKTGTQFSLAVNGTTGEVMNNSKALLETGAITTEEITEESLEPPQSYGNYKDYRALCCFVALVSYKPIQNLDDIFQGHYDKSDMVQQSIAFDSFVEVISYLKQVKALGKYSAELICPRETFDQAKAAGLSTSIIKIVDYEHIKVVITPIPPIKEKEALPEIEIEKLKHALVEAKQEETMSKDEVDELGKTMATGFKLT